MFYLKEKQLCGGCLPAKNLKFTLYIYISSWLAQRNKKNMKPHSNLPTLSYEQQNGCKNFLKISSVRISTHPKMGE